MKNSLFILLIFSAGIAAGIFRLLPAAIDPNTLILSTRAKVFQQTG